MKKRTLPVLLMASALSLLFSVAGCNKAVLHSRDREMEPVSRTFSAPPADAFKSARQALVQTGYKIEREDEAAGTLETGWRSTKASSHYVDLFDRRDYGTVGAYYKIQVRITESGGKSQVEVSAPVRSIVGRIKSSHSEEDKLLDKIAELLRPEDFEMTNVGITE